MDDKNWSKPNWLESLSISRVNYETTRGNEF